MNLLVIIPAHNEEASIVSTVENLKQTCPDIDFLVVNDGSTDATAEICRKHGYNLLDLPINLGLSGAFQAGMRYAAQHQYNAALQFDADGQHRAEYIYTLQESLKSCDIVIGSRFITKDKPRNLRMLGSFIIGFSLRFTSRHNINDPTSGMRMYNRKMIEAFAKDASLTPEPDTLSFLLRCGVKINEVPVEMDERLAGDSYFNLWRSMKYMVEMTLSIFLVQWFRKNTIESKKAGG